jgi:hypothetical protein
LNQQVFFVDRVSAVIENVGMFKNDVTVREADEVIVF